MSTGFITKSILTDIASAIREKTKSNATIKPIGMAQAIANIGEGSSDSTALSIELSGEPTGYRPNIDYEVANYWNAATLKYNGVCAKFNQFANMFSTLKSEDSPYGGSNGILADVERANVDFSNLEAAMHYSFTEAFKGSNTESADFSSLVYAGYQAFQSAFEYTCLDEVDFSALRELKYVEDIESEYDTYVDGDSEGESPEYVGYQFYKAFANELNGVVSGSAEYDEEHVFSADFSGLELIEGDSSFEQAFSYREKHKIGTIDFSSLETITGNNVFKSAFEHTKSAGEGHAIGVRFDNLDTITGNNVFEEAFAYHNDGDDSGPFGLAFANGTIFPSLRVVNGNNVFANMFKYSVLSSDSNVSGSTVTLNFPSLETIQGNVFNNMLADLSNVDTIELHFPAAMQSAIEAQAGYSTCFGAGAGNATFVFDL